MGQCPACAKTREVTETLLQPGPFSPHLKAYIVQCQERSITVQYIDVQWQTITRGSKFSNQE